MDWGKLWLSGDWVVSMRMLMSGVVGVVECCCVFVGDGESAPEGMRASSAHWSVVGGGVVVGCLGSACPWFSA